MRDKPYFLSMRLKTGRKKIKAYWRSDNRQARKVYRKGNKTLSRYRHDDQRTGDMIKRLTRRDNLITLYYYHNELIDDDFNEKYQRYPSGHFCYS